MVQYKSSSVFLNTIGGLTMLMAVNLFRFFGTPIGRWVGLAIGVLLVLAMVYVTVLNHNASIRREANLAFQRQQLEQVVRDQERFISELNAIKERQEQILANTRAEREALERRIGNINRYLSSDEARNNNREASPVLKETIRRLSDPQARDLDTLRRQRIQAQ
jgi:uncharacterized membrane protein